MVQDQEFLSADLLNRQGAELHLQGDVANARQYYLESLSLDPEFLPALSNLVGILSQENELLVALSFVRKILGLDPQSGSQWNAAGNLLTRLQRYPEALEALNRASELIPDERSVWHNLALLHHRMDNNSKALEYIQRVKDMGDESRHILNDEAHILMALGDLDKSLEAYEIRWHHLQHLPPWDFHVKEWTGEDLKGKTILVHAEQGYGDTIMTARFAPDLENLGAKVTLGLPRDMCSLFLAQDWCEGVLAIEDINETNMKGFDYQSPMYSTMRHLKITQESIISKPYLRAPEIVVPKVYKDKFNVGICWASGKRNNELDWRRRVTPLSLWFPLGEIPGVHLWSLYKEHESEDPHKEISAALITDLMPKFTTWAETSALVEKLDIVVTIDTAVGHLSAAMGKKTIMLAQYQHCWRWWNLNEGNGRPWYDCMTIIPQNEPNNWAAQISQAKSLVELMVRDRGRQKDLAA